VCCKTITTHEQLQDPSWLSEVYTVNSCSIGSIEFSIHHRSNRVPNVWIFFMLFRAATCNLAIS